MNGDERPPARYGWPAASRGRGRRRNDRAAWNVGRDAGAELRSPVPPATPASRSAFTPALAPSGRTELWLPLGPTVTLDGTAAHDARNAGRCRDVQANPADPGRVYVASANGGVWYSENFGATWEQVGTFTTLADRTQLPPSATSLSCGAIYVIWGATAADDEVWVGTGEPDPNFQPYDRGYKGQFAGLGILHARGPVAAVRNRPNDDPWERQAQPRTGYAGLRGGSVYSFAADPADPRHIVVASTQGLHVHDPAAAAGTDPWSLVTVAAWDAAAHSPGSANLMVTDVVWTGGRLWAALRQEHTPLTGLWRSDSGVAGPFVEVPLPVRTAAGEPRVDRIALAAAPGAPDILYVIESGPDAAPRLHRVDGPSTVRAITGRPGRPFFGDPNPGDPDQSGYDMAIAVDPDNPRRFIIGGAFSDAPDGMGAALFRLTVPAATPPASGNWVTDYGGRQGADPTWIGREVHPDVHRVRWFRSGTSVHVYVCNDGGLYHSASGGDPDTFISRNTGMSITETVYLAQHPVSEGVLLVGVQDNGVQLRIGDGVWRRAVVNGDGGGVAFDPNLPGRLIGQATRSIWSDDDNDALTLSPTFRLDLGTAFTTENRASCFYSDPAVIGNGARTQLAVGTTRVWYSEDWGRSHLDTVAGVIRRDWVVLPNLTDPRAGNAANTTLGVLPSGPLPAGTIDVRGTGIRVLRWSGVDRLYALMPGAVHRLDRAAGVWTRTQIELRPTLPVGGAPPPAPAMGVGVPHLPPNGSLNDLAVHDPTRGVPPDPHGSFYVATSHPDEPIWWFDGDHSFFACGLGSTPPPPPPVTPGSPGGIKATGYAVLVDPDDPSVVYVGTSLGVFRGVLTLGAGGPSWAWRDLNNSLPEAAVQDLTIGSWARPQGGTLKLMRACLQSRGVYELDLGAPVDDLTFFRAHPYDTRRMVPTPMADPLHRADRLDREWPMDWAYRRNRDHRTSAGLPAPHPDGTPRTDHLWHASPDLRVRPAPSSAPPPVPVARPGAPFPWHTGVTPADRFALWSLQTALHAGDERIVADGVWSAIFERRLAAFRAARGLTPAGAVVDAALWNHADVQAGFWADPWAAGGPREADLIERIVGQLTPRPGAAAIGGASVALRAGPSRVEVCVHRRGLDPAHAAEVGVLLLRRQVVEPVADWGTIAVPAVTGLDTLDGLPAGGGPIPAGVTVPAGWEVADTSVNVRRPGRDVGTSDPAVLSFTVDFSGRTGVWLLLALVRHGGVTPVLSGAANLAGLVPLTPHVAARTVELV
jgi:hypothetical protein